MQNAIPSRPRRRLVQLGVVLVVAAAAAVGVITPARAAPVSITVYGHGYGHGRGMGQYGAQGYATTYGWGSAHILDHYYSNTYAAGLGSNPTISVWLQAQDGTSPVITSGAPFRVSDSANPNVFYDQPAGAGVRAVLDGSGKVTVSGLTGCNGAPFGYVQLQGQAVFTSTVGGQGANLGQMLTVCGGPTYRGTLRYLAQPGGSRMANDVALESYLRGVVPRESPAWFAPAALQAQAVAARSYAWADGGEGGNRYPFAKTCDTTSCQVYGGAGLDGVARETPQTDAAVAATTGLVRRLAGGGLARTEFSSSTGGWTTPGQFPAVIDAGDAVATNSRHSWSTTLSVAALVRRYGLGTYVDLVITQRTGNGDWGGRALSVSVVGTSRTTTMTAAAFQSDWGLFSTWFSTTPEADTAPGPGVAGSGASLGLAVPWKDSGVYFATAAAGGTPSGWQTLGGLATSSTAVASRGDGRWDVFVRGGDGGLWTRSLAGGVWTAWTSLGGVLESGPAAVSSSDDRLDVFATGTDGSLWTRSLSGGSWSSWAGLGGRLVGAPAVSTRGGGVLDVFAVGTDRQLYQLIRINSSWSDWRPQGGVLSSGPASVTTGAGRVDVFGRGGDGSLWTRVWNGSRWSSWSSLSGIIASAPAVATVAGDIEVVARVYGGAVYRIRQSSGAWGSWRLFAAQP